MKTKKKTKRGKVAVKTKKAKRTTRKKSRPAKQKRGHSLLFFQRYALVAILILILLLPQIFTLPVTDWAKGFEVLDVSSSWSETAEQLSITFSPMVEAVIDLNNFYQAAATEAAFLLDASNIAQITLFVDGVDEFYRLSSIEMQNLLDLSDQLPIGRVAGISIEN